MSERVSPETGFSFEQKLAALIEERSGVPTEAKYLPEKIDQIIKNAIEGQI